MKFNNFHAKRAEELVRRPAHTPYFSAQRKDYVQILKDLDKIGCTSAIQASLIAFGLHYLSARRAPILFDFEKILKDFSLAERLPS